VRTLQQRDGGKKDPPGDVVPKIITWGGCKGVHEKLSQSRKVTTAISDLYVSRGLRKRGGAGSEYIPFILTNSRQKRGGGERKERSREVRLNQKTHSSPERGRTKRKKKKPLWKCNRDPINGLSEGTPMREREKTTEVGELSGKGGYQRVEIILLGKGGEI